MLPTGNFNLPRTLAIAAALGSFLGGCTSVEYTSQAQMSAEQTVVPLAKPVNETGYAMTPDATGAAAAIAGTASAAGIAPVAAAQTVVASVSNGDAAAGSLPGVDQAGDGIVNASVNERMAASYAEMPSSAEMLTIQTVVPSPRPSTELAYASPGQIDALAAVETRPVLVPGTETDGTQSALQSLIAKYAKLYEVPEELVHRVVRRESRYNPKAYSRGNYGLMQIRYNTARGLGYTGSPAGLFDAETNLRYAVKYLRGAWLVADTNHDGAVRLYSRGYYYDAKRKGLLNVVQ